MTKIRPYQTSDWDMVSGWWTRSGEIGPLPEMMPLDSSFIAEIDGEPVLAVAVYLTNTPEIAYVENFIGNPDLKGDERRQAALLLADHITSFAKGLGYKRLMCMTEKAVLKSRYMELGFIPTLDGITTFIRRTE